AAGHGGRSSGGLPGRSALVPGSGPSPGGGFAPPGGFVPSAGPPSGLQFPGPSGGRPGRTAGGLHTAPPPAWPWVKALQQSASHYSWVAAAVGANTAAGYQLGTGDPVMAIGGFNGTDPDPTLAEFKQLVAQ